MATTVFDRKLKDDGDQLRREIRRAAATTEEPYVDELIDAALTESEEGWDDDSGGQSVAAEATARFFDAMAKGATDRIRLGAGVQRPPRGNLTGKMLLATAIADLDDGMSPVEAAGIMYGEKSAVVDAMQSKNEPRPYKGTLAEAAALSTEDHGHGGALWRPTMAEEVIQATSPYLVLDQLRPRQIPLPHGGLTMGRMRTGTKAHYTTERPDVPMISPAPETDALEFKEHTLQALLPIPKAWIRAAANGEGVALMEAELVDLAALAVAQRKNRAWMLDDGTMSTPKGLWHHTSKLNKFGAHPGPGLAPAIQTLTGMWARMAQKDIRHNRPAMISNPLVVAYLMGHALDGMGRPYFHEMISRGQLMGAQLAHTSQIPFNLGGNGDLTLMFRVEMTEVLVANGAHVDIEVVPHTAYDDGTGMQSTTQGGEVILMIEETHDFHVAHTDGVNLCATPWAHMVGLPPVADDAI